MIVCPVCKENFLSREHWISHTFRQRLDYAHRQYIQEELFAKTDFVLRHSIHDAIHELGSVEAFTTSFVTLGMVMDYLFLFHQYTPRWTLGKPSTKQKSIEFEDLSVLQLAKLLYLSIPYDSQVESVYHNLMNQSQVMIPCAVCGTETDTLTATGHLLVCVGCANSTADKYWVSINKEFKFAAAHQLPYHTGLCQYLHGHEWKFQVTCFGPPASDGILVDFSDLKKIVNEFIINRLDHNFLNAFLPNPTAENITQWILKQLREAANFRLVNRVDVWESPTSQAKFVVV